MTQFRSHLSELFAELSGFLSVDAPADPHQPAARHPPNQSIHCPTSKTLKADSGTAQPRAAHAATHHVTSSDPHTQFRYSLILKRFVRTSPWRQGGGRSETGLQAGCGVSTGTRLHKAEFHRTDRFSDFFGPFLRCMLVAVPEGALHRPLPGRNDCAHPMAEFSPLNILGTENPPLPPGFSVRVLPPLTCLLPVSESGFRVFGVFHIDCVPLWSGGQRLSVRCVRAVVRRSVGRCFHTFRTQRMTFRWIFEWFGSDLFMSLM